MSQLEVGGVQILKKWSLWDSRKMTLEMEPGSIGWKEPQASYDIIRQMMMEIAQRDAFHMFLLLTKCLMMALMTPVEWPSEMTEVREVPGLEQRWGSFGGNRIYRPWQKGLRGRPERWTPESAEQNQEEAAGLLSGSTTDGAASSKVFSQIT